MSEFLSRNRIKQKIPILLNLLVLLVQLTAATVVSSSEHVVVAAENATNTTNATIAPTLAPGPNNSTNTTNATIAPTLSPVPNNSTNTTNVTVAPTISPGLSPAPTLSPANNHTNTTNTTTAAPTLAPANATTAAPAVTPTTAAPTPAPVTAAPTLPPVTMTPTAAPSGVPPPPARHMSAWRFIEKTIALFILLVLALLAFGAIMSNRYRIYFFLRGVWYTILGMECTKWIMRKLRLSDYQPVDSGMSTVIFENEMDQGLLMRETDT